MAAIVEIDFTEKFFYSHSSDLRRIIPDLPAGFSLADRFHGNPTQQIIASLVVNLFHEVVLLQDSEPYRTLIAQLKGDRKGWIDGDNPHEAEYVRRQMEQLPPLKEYHVSFREIEDLATNLFKKGFRTKLSFIRIQSDKTDAARSDDLLAQGIGLVHGGSASLIHQRIQGRATYFAYNWFNPDGTRKPLNGEQGIMEEVIRDLHLRTK